MPENMGRAEKTVETKRILEFGNRKGGYAPKDAFGDKASVLVSMSSMDIPVPPGFVLNVSVCEDYFKNSRQLPADVPGLLRQGISFLESATGKVFGGLPPLMVSVRSGAAISMPGSMETLLNIGLSRDTVQSTISMTGNPGFAWDSYRRLIEDFGRIIFSNNPFRYRDFKEESGKLFPEEVYEQLELSVRAVLDSWMSPRAKEYREIHDIKGIKGTAITVQAMVFGNMDLNSGAGIAFYSKSLDRGKTPSHRLQVRCSGRRCSFRLQG